MQIGAFSTRLAVQTWVFGQLEKKVKLVGQIGFVEKVQKR
jgi:hypothetical protein